MRTHLHHNHRDHRGIGARVRAGSPTMTGQCEKSTHGRPGINREIRYETTWDTTASTATHRPRTPTPTPSTRSSPSSAETVRSCRAPASSSSTTPRPSTPTPSIPSFESPTTPACASPLSATTTRIAAAPCSPGSPSAADRSKPRCAPYAAPPISSNRLHSIRQPGSRRER